MMVDRFEMLKRRLVGFYDLAIAADSEKHFFLWLYDYLRVIDTEDDLGGIFSAIKEQKEIEYKQIQDLMPKAEEEIEKTYKEVIKYVEDNKIDHKVILKELEEYKMAKEGKYSSSRGHLEDLYDKLSYTLMTMTEDGTTDDLKFAQRFGAVSDERRISEWTFSPSYAEYDLLTSGLKNIQETRLWYCWDKLVIAFKAIDDFKQEVVQDLLKNEKHFEAVNWAGLRSEMREILDEKHNPNSRPYEFISKDYRYYLAKVHQFAEEYVQSNPLQSKQMTTKDIDKIELPKEVKWQLSKDENYVRLSINREPFLFQRDLDYAGILLAELDDNLENCVVCEDIYEKMVDRVNPEVKNPTRVPYDAGRALNRKIFDKIGVNDFLIVKPYSISFNKAYPRIVLSQ